MPTALQRRLGDYYTQIDDIRAATAQNDVAMQEVVGLSRPVPLDTGVRYAILAMLDRLHGRIEMMDLISGQLVRHIEQMHMAPAASASVARVRGFDTYRFCRT